MIDGLTGLLDGLINKSRATYDSTAPKYEHNRWKYCVALAKCGWKAYDFEPIKSDTSDAVIIKWRKEGKKDVNITLSFTEQQMWLKYMENKDNERNDK